MTIIDTSTIDVTPAKASRQRPTASLFGAAPLLVRRRLWRDRWLLVSSMLIVALATLLAYAGPQLVLRTIDAGARDAVDAAGPAADLVVTFPVGNTAGDNLNSVPGTDPAQFDALATQTQDNLPGSVGALIVDRDQWVLSSQIGLAYLTTADEFAAAESEDRDTERSQRLGDYFQFGYATDADVTVVEGDAPAEPTGDPTVESYASEAEAEDAGVPDNATVSIENDGTVTVATPEVIEIALSAPVADTLEVGVGDLVTLRNPVDIEVTFRVTGLVEATDPDAAVWDHFPEFAEPAYADNPALPLFRRGTVIVPTATLAAVTDRFSSPFPGTVYMDVGSEGLTLASSRTVARDVRELASQSSALLPEEDVAVSLQTGLGPALDAYPARARAALAQMSVVVAGVVSVAAVVIALMARLLLSRRESDISLERARGASVPSIGVRLLTESLLFTVAGFAVGFAVARVLVGDVPAVSGIALVVVAVSVLAAPVLGVLMARRTWTGRREPANRQDRAKVRKAKAARRLTLEALAVVLGVLAVVTLRGRGVLQTQTSGIDPFLAAAPVLLALAVVVIVVRLYPIPMAIIQFFAKRTRGVSGVITLAKAREKIPVLPLLALTLAISVAVSGGLLVGTVRNGQEQASWERVGGQVRIDAEVTPVTADQLTQQGLTVSIDYQRSQTTFALGSEYADANVLAIDANYADVIEAAGIEDPAELRDLHAANEARAPGDPIPVLASPELVAIDFDERSELYIGRTYIPVDIIGTATVTPDGWTEGPYVMMPLEALLEVELESAITTNLAFVTGDGAEEIVASTTAIPPQAVTTRSGWLAAVRDSALIGGVERMMTLAVIAVAVLAAVALLVTVLQGVRERGRSLSMLRTQGMGAGYGWWLALSELAPLTVAAVIGGAGAGLIILVLLGSTLGLEVLAGGIAPPPLVANPVFLGAVGVGVLALLLFAVAAEVLAHRRNKLSDVLRYGESR